MIELFNTHDKAIPLQSHLPADFTGQLAVLQKNLIDGKTLEAEDAEEGVRGGGLRVKVQQLERALRVAQFEQSELGRRFEDPQETGGIRGDGGIRDFY